VREASLLSFSVWPWSVSWSAVGAVGWAGVFGGNKNLLLWRRRLPASTELALASGKEEASVRVVPVHSATQFTLWGGNVKPQNG
jgi:hypothetical protein